MAKNLSVEDFVAIENHMGKYCWLIDENMGDEWVNLWTEDGAFSGIAPEPIVGREALKGIPVMQHSNADQKLRHQVANFHAEYGASKNEVIARFYNLVTDWGNGGKFFCMAICEAKLVRDGEGWKIKRNDARLFV